MSDNGESSREPQVATSQGGEAATQAPATTTSTRQGTGGKVQRRSLPRTTRDTNWASGSGIGPGIDSAAGDPPDAHGAAAAGVATPGGELPHRGQLEGAFGRDLSSIVAHTGPDAQQTSRAMGANAYATGHHVILPQNAGVGLVAHEVTHVLQQEKGVHLSGGLDGGASDPLEQEADAVGAAVERGESVAGRFSAPVARSAPVGDAIQRDTTTVSYVQTLSQSPKKDEPKVSDADKAEAVRRFRVDSAIAGMKLLSARWQAAVPLVYGKDIDVNAPIDPQKVPIPAFRQTVYNLLVADRTDASPAQAALEAPGRDDYKAAFVAAQQDLDLDTPYLGQIKETIDNIVAGGQMSRNRTRLIAHHSMLRAAGKRAMAQVPSLGTQKLADYMAGPAADHGKLEDDKLGAIGPTTHVPTVEASQNAQGSVYRPMAIRQLYDMLHENAPKLEATPQAAAPGESKPAVSEETQKKVDALRLAIETALGKVVKGSDGLPVLPLGDQTLLVSAIELAGDEAREIVHADKALMSRLMLAVDPAAAKAILAKLDPVERLFRELEGLRAQSEQDGIDDKIKVGRFGGGIDPEKIRELIPFKQSSPVYAKVRQWLTDRKSKDKEAQRKRLLDHTKLKDDFIDRLPASESRIIYRLIYRGTEDPGPEDKVHEAAEKKDAVGVVMGLRELAGADPARLKALEKDTVFRASVSGMNDLVKLPDGQLVRPWHLCLTMWGIEPGNNQGTDPGTAKLTEIDPSGDNTPLDINQRMKLEGELFEPCLKQLNDEITGKNMREEYTYLGDQKMKRTIRIGHIGDPQAVSNILVNHDRIAAKPEFVVLLRREHLVFGREVERRYQERYGVDLRTWIYENAGPVNRSGANRVLGNEQGASVGMFNGKMLSAGEVDQAGKMTLTQALREHTWEDRPIYEWASVSSRAIAHNLGNKDKLLEEWDRFAFAVAQKAPEITKATGIKIRAIDLMRNAYMEHSGHFQTHLEAKYKDEQQNLATIKERLGLTADVDVPADAPPLTIAEQAEKMYKTPAAFLWTALSMLFPNSEKAWYTNAGTAMSMRKLPRVPDDPKNPPQPGIAPGQDGYTVEERPPRSFIAYYQMMYGTTPDLHAAAVIRGLGDQRVVPAEEAATLVGIDPKMVTGPWTAPAEKASIGAHNRHLVRASFTMEVAKSKAEQIWQILLGSARLDLIQTILAEHNEEEQAIIRAEFRAISGGFDLTFYIRQMMMEREREKNRLTGASRELSAGNVLNALGGGPNRDAMMVATNQWGYRVDVATNLTERAGDVAGMNQYTGIQSRSTDSELDQMLSVATTGSLDVRARLRAACKRDSQHEIKLIVDELTVPERKLVLQDGELMNDIYSHLEQYDEERVYKVLTGQGDLADRLYSRSHGGSWSERKLWGGTDEDGMRQDIRLYVRQLRLKHNADVRGEVSRMVQAGNAPPRQDQIDKEVDRRVGEACLKLASNDSVKAIMKSELTKEEFAEMESMILSGTAEARDWAVAGGAGKNDILADIRGMSIQQRKERLNDPNYMRLLGTRLREEKDYREALAALQEGIGGGGSGLSKLDEVSRSATQAEGSKPDSQKTLDALTTLSQPEFEALKNNPALQVQVMSAMNAEHQAIARDYLAGPGSMKMAIETADKAPTDANEKPLWGRGAGGKGGTLADDTLVDRGPPQTVGPDGKPLSADEAAKQADAQLAAQKEAYVRFIVHQSIHRVGAPLRSLTSATSWSFVLEAAVEVYKADLPAISADKNAKLDKTAPRQIIWAALAPHMTAFAAFHDKPENAGQLTLQPITGSQMTGVVKAAVLGQKDPSDELIESKILTKAEQDKDEERLRKTDPAAATKKYGMPIIQQVEGEPFKPMPKDDVAREEDIKDAIGSASDEKVIQNWTTYLERPPGGTKDNTMKARYDEYRVALEAAQKPLEARVKARQPKQKPADVSPKAPPPQMPSNAGSNPDAAIDAAADKAKADAPAVTTELGPLGDKDPAVARMEETRGRFLEFRATESVVFEAMLRQFMGDDRTLTPDGTYDPNKAKISITKNKRYNNLVEALLQRALHLRPETVAALLGIRKEDIWLLKSDMRGEVGQMALSQQKNLRYSGAQRSVGSTAVGEKEQLDVTTFLLYKTFADATTDYKISGEEKENLAYRRDQNDRARDSYKTALETAAMWASLITSVLITLAATILTGGLALGPLGMMAIGGVTMLLSAHAQAAVNKSILQDEFDLKDKKELITKEVMTGLVTMGTTFFAQGLLSTLGKGARLFQQASLAKQVFQKPPSIWGVFLREASEEVVSEGMDNVVQAHLEATNPEHWVDGMKIGAKRARAASDAILARAPDDMFTAAVTSLVTAGVGKLKKGKGKPEFSAPKDARKRTVNLRKNLKMVFGDPEEKFTAAGLEWLMSQRENGKIDWDNAPEELLKGLLQEYKESVHEVHGQYAHHGMQSRKVDRHLAAHGHHLQNATEVKIFTDINKDAGTTDPFVSAKDFARIRTEVAVAGLQAHEAQNGPLTNAQREAFVAYVREAPTTEILHERAKQNPLSVHDVKFADANSKANTAVGKPITSDQTAFKVMRDLADGKTSSLGLLGIEVPPGFDPTKNEWGLGRRVDVTTGEVSYVLIKGEDGAVNWEGFPGVEPIAHSHPDKGPNGRNSNHLKKLDADGGVDLVKLCTTDGADRIHFMPSGADLVFVLSHRIGTHTVLTPFQHLGGGKVGNPTPGSNNAGINIVIKNPKLYGHLFGNPKSAVAEVEIEIWAGNERLHTMKLWGSDHLGGSHLWHAPPADMIMPVDLGAGGDTNGQPGPRRTPSGRRHNDDDHNTPGNDPNHPANRPTQVIPTVAPPDQGNQQQPAQDPNAPHNRQTQVMPRVVPPTSHDHDPNASHNRQTQQIPQVTPQDTSHEVAPQSEYDKATQIWKGDQTSAADLKAQIGEEEWETALGHVKEARLDPQIGPTIEHIPDHQLVALFLYTDYHYRRWNLALRENDQEALKQYAGKIKAADSALAALPNHEGWVERGTGILDDHILAQYVPGAVITEQAFTSASAGQGNQGGFTGGATVFHIKSATGKRIDKLAKRGENETEVLFRPGTRFVVTGRTQQDHTTIITMEEIPSEDHGNQGNQGGQGNQGNQSNQSNQSNQNQSQQDPWAAPNPNDIAPRRAGEEGHDAEAAGKRQEGRSWLPFYDTRARLGLLTPGERRHARNEQAIGPNRRTTDPAIIASHQNVVVDVVLTEAQGQQAMRALADGNADALRALGINLPAKFDPKQTEWALGQMKDGTYRLVRGGPGKVSAAGRFPDMVEYAAHSHDLPSDRVLPRPMPITEVLASPQFRHLLSPSGSQADVGLVRALEKHGQHTIYLPYQHLGNGVIGHQDSNKPNQPIGNADMNGRAPGLQVQMTERPRIVGTFGTDAQGNPAPVYRVPVEFRAGNDTLHTDEYVVYMQDGQERMELSSAVGPLLMVAQQQHTAGATSRGLGGQVGSVDGMDAVSGAPHRPLGYEMLDFNTAESVLKRVARGEVSALGSVGMVTPGVFVLPEVHWAIGQQANDAFVLIRGDQHGVIMPPGVKLIAEHAPANFLFKMPADGFPVSKLGDNISSERSHFLPTLDRLQHFNSGAGVTRYDTGYTYALPPDGSEGRIYPPTLQPPGAAPGTLPPVSVFVQRPDFVGRLYGQPVYRANVMVLASTGATLWSGPVWVHPAGHSTVEPFNMTPPMEGETWVPVDTGRQPANPAVAPAPNPSQIGPGARWRDDGGGDDDEGGGRRSGRRNRDEYDEGGGRRDRDRGRRGNRGQNQDQNQDQNQGQDRDDDGRVRIDRGIAVLQVGGNDFVESTANALNANFNTNYARREWGRALEALKETWDLPNDHHGRIYADGSYTDEDGWIYGNLSEYVRREG
jgi:hypothetical protein